MLLASSPLAAVEYRLTTGVSSEHTDNVGRASDESGLVQDDWIHRPMLRGVIAHQGPKLQLDADYMVEHRIYTEDLFDDRTRFTGRANFRWDAIADVLQIVASNSRTEATEDALGQDIETNRQISSVFSAGPRLVFRPRSSDRLLLEYRFSDVSQNGVQNAINGQNFQDPDSERQLISAIYELGLTENRTLALELSRDNVEFSRDQAPELDIDTAALNYVSKGDALQVKLRAGYTTIDRSLNRGTVDGAIGNLELQWQVSGSGRFDIRASRSINDQSANVLRGNAGFGQGSVFENTDVNEVFEEDILQATYTHRWGRNEASLGYNLQNKDYDDIAFAIGDSRDEDESGFVASYARRVTPKINLRMSAAILERDFQDRGVDEDYLTADLRIDWRAGRALTLFAGAAYEDRDASGAQADLLGLSFDQFSFQFGFTFDIVDRFTNVDPFTNRPQFLQQR